eukprot:213092_1
MALTSKQNYFICPQQLTSKTDCLEFIQSIADYSTRCYKFEDISEKELPFPILFMLNILRHQSNIAHKIMLNLIPFIYNYIEEYFAQHYNPAQIPLLYAIILHKQGLICNVASSNQLNSNERNSKSITYWQEALKFINIYQHQLENNKLNQLSKAVNKRLQYDQSFSTLHGQILYHLSIAYVQTHNGEMMNQLCEYFIINHRKYSSYSLCGYVSWDFAATMIKQLVIWDTNQTKKYQKRYKYLLKIALKWFNKCYQDFEDKDLCSKKCGSIMAHIGYYYALFENNFDKSSEYIHKGINIIKTFDEYAIILRDMYQFLFFVERARCKTIQMKNVLTMRMDHKRHHNLTSNVTTDKNNLKLIKDMNNWSEIKKRKLFVYCWTNVMQERNKMSNETISKERLLECSNYVKYYYRT